MFRKLVVGILATSVVFILIPLVVNPATLAHPQLWVLVGICMLASMTQPGYNPIDRKAPPEDRGTSVQIVWTVYVTQLIGVIEAVYVRYPAGFAWDGISTAALVVALAGVLFRAWAVAELGRFFTWHVRVQAGQSLVSTGPYRFVRHPSYTGALLLYVCTLLFVKAWITAGFAAVFILIAFRRRIRYEEGLLVSTLGEAYEAYCHRVKRLVPLCW